MMKKLVSTLFSLTILAYGAMAQISTPSASPTADLKITVGLTDIMINYSRPGVKDRVVFAMDGLVPYGKIWRTGANAVTKFSFSDAVKLGGQDIKKGDYAVLTKPNKLQWTVMLYPYEGRGWNSYVEKEPAASFTIKPQTIGHKVESFTIDVNNLRSTSATIDMVWEKTLVSIPMEVSVDDKVMADIERTMGGPTPGEYFSAASYYHESGKDLNQALEWIKNANHKDPKYWTVRREALILADMKRYPEAVKAATKSMGLAQQAGNEEYVAMNKKSIDEWSSKLKSVSNKSRNSREKLKDANPKQ